MRYFLALLFVFLTGCDCTTKSRSRQVCAETVRSRPAVPCQQCRVPVQ